MSNLYESKFAGDFFWKMLHQEDENFCLGMYFIKLFPQEIFFLIRQSMQEDSM